MKLFIAGLWNDLGSRTLGENLVEILSQFADCQTYHFAAAETTRIDHSINTKRSLVHRILDARELAKQVRRARREDRVILFHNASPAIFSLGAWKPNEVFITTDWTHRLFEHAGMAPRQNASVNRFAQASILRLARGLLPTTSSLEACFRETYGIASHKVRRVLLPIDTARFLGGITEVPRKPRLLFVGGDIVRKGGDMLLETYREHLRGKCSLTMMTNAAGDDVEGVEWKRNVRFGDPRHAEIIRSHDMLVLPTHQDAGPQVLAEAAAAGLAVATTRFALGAPDVVKNGQNGIISDSPAVLLNDIIQLVQNSQRIQIMKAESRRFMAENYTREKIAQSYLEAIGNIITGSHSSQA